MTFRFLSAILVVVLCGNVFGESSAPPTARDTITVPATLNVDPVQEMRLGSFVVKFEKTTLTEIRDALGTGSIEHAGDAGESHYWLCYSLPGQRVWLISHGEMGGSEHALTGVHAISMKSTPQVNASCPSIPNRFQSISFYFGWIGTDQQSLVKSLGQPSGKEGGNFIFFFHRKIYKEKTVIGDVIGYVEATIVDNKVTSLKASHVTSY
jgi:hypothetical protein